MSVLNGAIQVLAWLVIAGGVVFLSAVVLALWISAASGEEAGQ